MHRGYHSPHQCAGNCKGHERLSGLLGDNTHRPGERLEKVGYSVEFLWGEEDMESHRRSSFDRGLKGNQSVDFRSVTGGGLMQTNLLSLPTTTVL